MPNTDESRAAAQSALQTYRRLADPDNGSGDESNLIDLIADLMHLADTFTGEDETSGEYCAERAADFYYEERDVLDEERSCGCGGNHETCPAESLDESDDYPEGEEPDGALPH